MNPSSPIVTSRPNTSTAIQSAHAALTEKARESGYVTNAISKRIETSPERSLIKGAAHKRMQSLQTGNVRDLSNLLEGGSFSSPKSPEKSAGRPSTPHKEFLLEGRSPEKSPERDSNRSATPTPGRETPTRDPSSMRSSLRRPPQSILGENTPPQSATMLALQTMANKDSDVPLSNVTNGSTALVRVPQTFDAISNQILSLTSIATSLQREMAQLSRRSKDNATDLVSLKEATNSRDEDIRKTLRELVNNISEAGSRQSSNIYGSGPLYLESKPHNSPGSRAIKSFTLPRIPSPNSFSASLDRESMNTPVCCNPDGAASLALLEKILREMGTKEGQDQLVSRLSEVADRLARDGSSTARKLDDLLQHIKANNLQAVAPLGGGNGGGIGGNRPRNFSFGEPPRLELDFDQPRSGPMMQRVEALLAAGANKENVRGAGTARAADIVNEDILKIIRTIKDSVSQGGGLTAEVKALVRELRGEVLGMGREIGRKLEQASKKDSSAKDIGAEKERVARVVQDGLEELKQHMDRVLREHRRQSSSSTVSRNTVDYQEIYNAVRAALNEKPQQSRSAGLGKEDIIEAVKEAWENYKPDIELQHFGLEREELLTCLKEGIQEYAPRDHSRGLGGASREEVFAAVVEGLKHFSPPRVETEESLSRDEILGAVRECLEEFEFPAAPAPAPREPKITRDDMVHAVKEGLHGFDFGANTSTLSRDIGGNLTRDDLFAAVKALFNRGVGPVRENHPGLGGHRRYSSRPSGPLTASTGTLNGRVTSLISTTPRCGQTNQYLVQINRARTGIQFGDHIPAYLLNVLLALDPLPDDAAEEDRELLKHCREMLFNLTNLILDKFPDPNPAVCFVNERFFQDWTPDHSWKWQLDGGIVGHNYKIAWNLCRVRNYALYVAAKDQHDDARWKDLAARCLETAKTIARKITSVGYDKVPSRWHLRCYGAPSFRSVSSGVRLEYDKGFLATGTGYSRIPHPLWVHRR